MASFRSSPIVAVFGGNDPSGEELAAARLLGAAVHQTDGVLLTGGRDVIRHTVKDAAVLSAVAVADPQDSEVWIGVARTEQVEPPEHRSHGIILKPGGMDRRNFVEACLCDAAIAIGTSLGTSSEALFALYLRRRVTLVGFTPVGRIGPTAEALLDHARERVEEPVNPRNPVEEGIASAYRWARAPNGRVLHRRLPTDPAEALRIVNVVRGNGAVRARPNFGALRDQRSWDAFISQSLERRT